MYPEENFIEYQSVILSISGITEKASILAPLHFKKDEIKKIEVKKDFVAEGPIAAIVFGLIILMGCIAVYMDIIAKFKFGGTIYIETFLSIVFLPIGVWLIIYGLKRKPLLLVHTKSGKRKIVFKGQIEANELSIFIQRAKRELGYDIITNVEGLHLN